MKEVIELRRYQTPTGVDVFGEWLAELKDVKTKAKILARVDRLSLGNFGDCKSLSQGLFELRIDWGPGYRVYYAPDSQRLRHADPWRKQAQAVSGYPPRHGIS